MRTPRLASRFVSLALPALLLAAPSTAQAQLPTDGLLLFHAYDEGSGSSTSDLTGNGHAGTLAGGASWGTGTVRLDGGDTSEIRVGDAADLHYRSFTWALWLTVDSGNLYNRILTQTDRIGGTGPEIFVGRDNRLAVRVNDADSGEAVIQTPAVGTRTNDGPPDHWGQTADAFPFAGAAAVHVVVVHDAPGSTMRIFFGREGSALRLQFEATYAGPFAVASDGIRVGNVSGGGRGLAGTAYQLAVWGRALSFTVDGSRNVTGGELLAAHAAGSNAALCVPATEVCNGVDENCNGVPDDGASCGSPDRECVGGSCVPIGPPDAGDDGAADVTPEVPEDGSFDAPADDASGADAEDVVDAAVEIPDGVDGGPACQAVPCNTGCRATGFPGGDCRGRTCVCYPWPSEDEGCGCAAPGSGVPSGTAWLALLAAGCWARRRKGRRHA